MTYLDRIAKEFGHTVCFGMIADKVVGDDNYNATGYGDYAVVRDNKIIALGDEQGRCGGIYSYVLDGNLVYTNKFDIPVATIDLLNFVPLRLMNLWQLSVVDFNESDECDVYNVNSICNAIRQYVAGAAPETINVKLRIKRSDKGDMHILPFNSQSFGSMYYILQDKNIHCPIAVNLPECIQYVYENGETLHLPKHPKLTFSEVVYLLDRYPTESKRIIVDTKLWYSTNEYHNGEQLYEYRGKV